MRKLQQFCPKCGKSVDHLIDNLCEQCYSEGKWLIEAPDHVKVIACPNCGRVPQKNRWVEPSESSAEDAVREALKINGPAQIDVRVENNKAFISAEGVLNETQKELKKELHEISLKRVKRMCDDCGRASGGYYEAILQVRSNDERNVQRVLMLLQEVLESPRGKYWFVARTTKVRGGVNIYLGSKVILTTLKQRVKEDMGDVETKLSHELYGQVKGKEVYRHVLVVRV